LAECSGVFDPLGWLLPLLIRCRILFQSLWLHKELTWDTKLPSQIQQNWIKLREEMPRLDGFKFNRWLGKTHSSPFKLHGFCDASTKAYACCIYMVYEDGPASLIFAKGRVTPIKPVTTPRLELMAACLLIRAVKLILQTLKLPITTTVQLWSDSQITLYWIRDEPRKFQSFVANRTAFILETLPAAIWNFVPTKENPADLPSRGCSSEELKESSLWWNGPNWIHKDSEWPTSNMEPKQKLLDTELELRKTICLKATSFPHAASLKWEQLITRISNLPKLIRVVAYIKRIMNSKKFPKEKTLTITCNEYQGALKELIIQTQIAHLTEIEDTIECYGVQLQEDTDGLIRLHGQLAASNLPHNLKSPIILP
jgi:Pao retrotransposon peptidase